VIGVQAIAGEHRSLHRRCVKRILAVLKFDNVLRIAIIYMRPIMKCSEVVPTLDQRSMVAKESDPTLILGGMFIRRCKESAARYIISLVVSVERSMRERFTILLSDTGRREQASNVGLSHKTVEWVLKM
jgi:hypothetical protein